MLGIALPLSTAVTKCLCCIFDGGKATPNCFIKHDQHCNSCDLVSAVLCDQSRNQLQSGDLDRVSCPQSIDDKQ